MIIRNPVDAYPTLWHYTPYGGLKGILESQELWATNVRYLNDEEEIKGFFDRRFPIILQEGIEAGILQMEETEEGRKKLQSYGGAAKVRSSASEINSRMRTYVDEHEIFVTSFCYTMPGADYEDGLLSQWRGYGSDGGYALIFETNDLHKLLQREGNGDYYYTLLGFSDVDYYDYSLTEAEKHPELLQWEQKIRDWVATVLVTGGYNSDLLEPIWWLATRHKHRGFREEREVRIMAVVPNKTLLQKEIENGATGKEKPILFKAGKAGSIPYISLFDAIKEKKPVLPIKEIVVGPQPERRKRQEELQQLLDGLGIQAIVRVSDIPYLIR
jgi:hypothetical protein